MILAIIRLFEDVDEDQEGRTIDVAVDANTLYNLVDGQHVIPGWLTQGAKAYVQLVNGAPMGKPVQIVVDVEDQEAELCYYAKDTTYKGGFIDLREKEI